MSEHLVSFLQRQRWFGAKAREPVEAEIVDEGGLDAGATVIAIAAVRFADGEVERYFVPLRRRSAPDAALLDAAEDDEACRALLDLLVRGDAVTTARGCVHSSACARGAAIEIEPTRLAVRRTGADQSNSSVVFGDELIMKMFRRIDAGLNPDVEICRVLTSRGFTRIPALVTDADYVVGDGPASSVLMLQQFVPNQGNAWQAMLQYNAVDAIALAETLGRRTGELHEALASDGADPAFAPEPLTRADMSALRHRMRAFGAKQLELLRRTGVPVSLRSIAGQVLDRQDAILARYDALLDVSRPGRRIRCHGDYHLGQTLVADGDVFILDFEGEPARPLADRREKSSALRDVAGMLRSFSYAAQTANRGSDWEQRAAAAFLDGYRQATSAAGFLPTAGGDFDSILAAFVLDKALYELGYELNNRPDRVGLPLAALARVGTPV